VSAIWQGAPDLALGFTDGEELGHVCGPGHVRL
jgi:hypothetical protein